MTVAARRHDVRGGAQRMHDRVGGRRARLRVLRVGERSIVLVVLDLANDAVHDLDRLERMLARRRFGREHHRVGAVVDRGGDVGGLGARRHRRRDHRLQHLRGDDHRLARAAAGAEDPPLHRRHLLGPHLDAEIAARDHDPVGLVDDRVEPR